MKKFILKNSSRFNEYTNYSTIECSNMQFIFLKAWFKKYSIDFEFRRTDDSNVITVKNNDLKKVDAVYYNPLPLERV